ncbi:MAG: hypothetical protein HC865_03370 [Cyanobacteria bacterium RU_5_0]|nr:hypothetical protein [Cyanobacteria bacterium RU_5_0]
MAPENSQIQALITEIDEVLNRTTPRLPWVMSNEALRQRQVLEQSRNYLVSLQQSSGSDSPTLRESSQSVAAAEASAQQILQAVVQEMNYLRLNMLQPLRSDIETLRLQRDALTQEIRQLEMQQQQYVLPPQQNPQYLTEFLQAAMLQMQENLMGQVAQMMASLTVASGDRSLNEAELNLASLSPVQRLERLRMFQAQSDQLMMKLDTTLRVIFESLQTNIHSYQESLEQGLSRMYSTGQQGEAVIAAFVARLARLLGGEASSFLQASMQSSGWMSAERSILPAKEPPFAEDPDSQITRLLQELNALDQSALKQAASGEPIPFDTSDTPRSSVEPSPLDEEADYLKQLNLELSQLDLTAIPPESDALSVDAEVSLFQGDESFPFPPLEDEEITRLPEDELNRESRFITPTPTPPELDDLESALDLLNQLTAEIDADSSRDMNWAEPTDASFEATISADEMPLVASPDSLYEDEFYQTLFGEPTDTDEPTIGEATNPPDRSMETESSTESIEVSGSQLEDPSEMTDFNQDWFAGLTDPATVEASLPTNPPPVEFPSADLPQTVESFLLSEPEPPPSEEVSLEMLMDEEVEDLTSPTEAIPGELIDEVETIASLMDLIPPSETEPASVLTAPIPIDRPIEEDYEPARPDEDLLVTDIPVAEPAVTNLRLPANTLHQLTTDLSSLEGADADAMSLSVTDDGDWALADWEESQPIESSPVDQLQVAGQEIASDSGVTSSVDAATINSVDATTIEALLFSDEFIGLTPTDENIPDQTVSDQNEEEEEEELEAPDAPDWIDRPEDLFATELTPEAERNRRVADEIVEATLEDLFAFVDAEPAVTPESAKDQVGDSEPANSTTLESLFPPISDNQPDQPFEFSWQPTEPPAPAEEDADAFTLDGLDSLFEGVPSIEPPPRDRSSEIDTQRFTLENIFDEPTPAPLQETNSDLESSSVPERVETESSEANDVLKKKVQI